MRISPLGHALNATLLATVLFARPLEAQKAPPNFDAYVRRVMQTFTVPGMSVAIVKDGKVVLAKGYGVRRMGDPAPVDARTRFGIASNTKLFTATALALLVEEGKVEWDAPVIQYLPAFAMYDPYVTRELTVRDLLVHRSGLGLGAGDLLWWPPSTYDRKEIARRLRFIPPATSFRSAYAYDNVLYLVAGELIEAVSGQSWEEFVRSRILRKVGMTDSDVLHSGAGDAGNVAGTHAEVEGTVRPIAPFLSDNTNPAGGIMSGAADMAKWMIVQLDSGRVARRRRGSSRRRGERALARRDADPDRPGARGTPAPARAHGGLRARPGRPRLPRPHPAAAHRRTAGIRLEAGDDPRAPAGRGGADQPGIRRGVRGHRVPRARSLSRRQGAGLSRDLRRTRPQGPGGDDGAGASRRRPRGTRPRGRRSRCERYAGTYRDAWYGDVTIALEGKGLVIRFTKSPSLVGDLVHWQHDSFLARWRDRELRADAYATFALKPDGTIERLTMVPSSPAVDFSFDFQDLLLRPVQADSARNH